jgi:hypothetical protein
VEDSELIPSLNAGVILPLTAVADLLRLGCWVESTRQPGVAGVIRAEYRGSRLFLR